MSASIRIIVACLLLVVAHSGGANDEPRVAAQGAAPGRELSGRVALITGSTRNLGRGYAVGLARNGAEVVVHYHLPVDRPDAEETARLVRTHGVRATRASVAGRLGRIDDIVPLVEFLASPRSQWITGQTLFINGGTVAR